MKKTLLLISGVIIAIVVYVAAARRDVVVTLEPPSEDVVPNESASLEAQVTGREPLRGIAPTRPEQVAYTGRVVSSLGVPIPGADVELLAVDPVEGYRTPVSRTLSSFDGTFHLPEPLAAGTSSRHISATKPGFSRGELRGVSSGTANDIVLVPAALLQVTVVDVHKKGVEDALVASVKEESTVLSPSDWRKWTKVTDNSGVAMFDTLDEGVYNVIVTSKSGPRVWTRGVAVGATRQADVTVIVPSVVEIIGRVVDSASLAPLSGCDVWIRPREDVIGRADGNGAFRVEWLAGVTGTMVFSMPGYALGAARVSAPSVGVNIGEIKLALGHTIRGYLAGGRNGDNVTVSCYGDDETAWKRTIVLGDDPTFIVSDAPPGVEVFLQIYANEQSFGGTFLTGQPGGLSDLGRIELPAAGLVRCRVRALSGLSGWACYWWLEENNHLAGRQEHQRPQVVVKGFATIGSDGTLKIGRLGAGMLHVVVSDHSGERGRWEGWVTGEERDIELVVPEGIVISGSVQVDDGSLAGACRIVAERIGEARTRRLGRVGNDSLFRLEDLPHGSYKLRLLPEDGSRKDVGWQNARGGEEVVAGATAVRLVVPLCDAMINVEIRCSPAVIGEVLCVASDELGRTYMARPDMQGRCCLRLPSEGVYTLELDSANTGLKLGTLASTGKHQGVRAGASVVFRVP